MNDDTAPVQDYSQEFEALDLQNIYSQLAVPDKSNFDSYNELEFANKCIEACFDKDFLRIDTDRLISDQIRFNSEFIKLIKFAKEKNFIKVHILFVAFCTYFNVDEVYGYKILHEKLQLIIKIGYAKMIGKDTYKKMTKLYSNKAATKQISLFELARKNQK